MIYSSGHSQSMMHPVIDYNGQMVIYMADMIPTQAHIPVPYVMGYDVRPLETMNEKSAVLKDASENNHVLFFEHDPFSEACLVEHTEKGIRKKMDVKLEEL